MLARYFGPKDLGLLSFIQSMSAVFLFLVVLGLDRFIIGSLVSSSRYKLSIILTSTIMRFIGWLIYSICLFLCVFLFTKADSLIYLMLLEVVSVFLLNVITVRYLLEADGSAKELTFSLLASRVIGLTYLFLAIYNDFSFIEVCVFLPLQSLVRLVLNIVFLKKTINGAGRAKFNGKWAKDNLALAFPIMISGAIFPLFIQADILLIAFYLGDEAVGLYSAPMRIISQAGFVGVAIMAAVYPLLVVKYNGDIEQFNSVVKIVAKFMFLVSFTASLLLYLSSELIINTLFGDKYLESIGVLKVLSWVVVFLISSKLYSALVIIQGNTKYELVKAIVAVTLNLLLNVLLIPDYGINGAAIASVVAYFFADFFSYYIFKQLKPISEVISCSLCGLLSPIKTVTEFKQIER